MKQKGGLWRFARHRRGRWLNNRVEQNHRRIKLRASLTACRVDELAIIGQARGARGMSRARAPFTRGPRDETPIKQNPP